MNEWMICTLDGGDESGVPREVKLLPFGHVHSQKGDFLVDDESFSLILKQFRSRRLDLVIDYEHQTLKDVQAPAGGWIKDLYKTEDAICAKVEWTKKAEEYLKNKEYKYLSPVVLCRKRDGKAVEIHSVALTNTPAIDGMFKLVNSTSLKDFEDGGKMMELEKLIAALGLEKEATEEDVIKAIQEAKKAAEEKKKNDPVKDEQEPKQEDEEVVANKTILGLLGLKEDAKTEDVAASIMELKGGGTRFFAQLQNLKEKMEKKEAEENVIAAMKEGKISAAQKEWAIEYALKDSAGFQKFIEKAPKVVPMGKLETIETSSNVELDEKALKNLGITKEDLEKYGNMEV